MAEFVKVDAHELTESALDWAVAKAVGEKVAVMPGIEWKSYLVWTAGDFLRWKPSTNWEQGGPLIEKHNIQTSYNGNGFSKSPTGKYWCAYVCRPSGAEKSSSGGSSALIAACRALVISALGETVSVPKELLPC